MPDDTHQNAEIVGRLPIILWVGYSLPWYYDVIVLLMQDENMESTIMIGWYMVIGEWYRMSK
jgi:hypothetical protein